MKLKAAVLLGLALVFLVAGCAQLSSTWDGVMAQPQTAQDLPAWYHLGALMVPVLAHLARFGLAFLGGLIGIVL